VFSSPCFCPALRSGERFSGTLRSSAAVEFALHFVSPPEGPGAGKLGVVACRFPISMEQSGVKQVLAQLRGA